MSDDDKPTCSILPVRLASDAARGIKTSQAAIDYILRMCSCVGCRARRTQRTSVAKP